MGFVDGLYGKRNTESGARGHDHEFDHAAPAKSVEQITASGAIPHLECDHD